MSHDEARGTVGFPPRSYTPKQLAALSGVSVRTLHFYEEQGLLHPQRAANNYRVYTTADVEALQRVLMLRACGLPLREVAQALGRADFDLGQTLEAHLSTLRARADELHTLIATVEQTVAGLKEFDDMSDQQRFERLKRHSVETFEREYGPEARERYGDAAIDAANERLMGMSQRAWDEKEALEREVKEQLRRALATGDVTGPEARELCRLHARWIKAHWGAGAYTPEAHAQLAQGYLADERFIAYYDAVGEGATRFLCDALTAWCADASGV